MTTGSIWKRMVSFAVPVFLGNLCQQLYNTVDSVIVGKFVGKQALAAVASSGNLIFMMTGFFMGLFIGAGIVIAQYFGARNYEKVRSAVHTDIAFALCCGVLLTLLGVFFTPTILTWMRTPADVLSTSILYFRLYFLGSLATILYNAGMGILQAVGDSRSPLYYLVISSVVNVALDLLFVGAMDMGVAGAAVATVISQVVSAVLCIIKLTRSDGPYRLEIKRIGFDLPLLKKITSQGVPSGVQNSIIAIANVVVQSNINTFGSDAMAGCGSYSKVEGFVFLPITAFAMALTTFIGQNLGAGQFDRAKQGARIGILCSIAMAELIGVALFFLAPYAMRLFNDDPAVVAIGVRQSHIESLFFCFLAFAHGVSAVLRGAGRAQVPMYTMLGCWCILRVSYITLALKVWPDIATIFWAYPITWSVSCVVFLLYYLKADWVHALEKSL
ncbi:MAG: MATE family efflux transporter [Oscillibacter sp.]|nr:MATE family efflux transporter [Oscillibacter sp.]